MTDLVLREITILSRDLRRCANTLWELRKALRTDERFATLESVRQPELFKEDKNIEKEGPEGLPDPFSVPLERRFE